MYCPEINALIIKAGAKYFNVDENEMLQLWLADKVIDAMEGESDYELKQNAIKMAQKEIR